MAIKSNQSAADAESQVNKKLVGSGPLNYILLFLVLGLVLYGVFLSFDKGRILASTTEMEQQTRDIQTQIDTIKSNKVEISQNASDAIKKIETEEIRWSEVISEIDKLIPQDSTGNPTVTVLSYSGTGLGKISLNMVSLPAALPPFEEVARILSTFNNSIFFKDAYVPSIAKSTTDNGEITLSFILSTDYRKPETGSDSLQINTVGTDTAAKVAVPKTTDTIKVPRNN